MRGLESRVDRHGLGASAGWWIGRSMCGDGDASADGQRYITVALEPRRGSRRITHLEACVRILDACPSRIRESNLVERHVIDLAADTDRRPQRAVRTRRKARHAHFEF